MLVFVTGVFFTAVTPVLSDQRAAVLRQGGHVLSRRFRYYVPDFSGRMVVQTPIIVYTVCTPSPRSVHLAPAREGYWSEELGCRGVGAFYW